MEDDDADVLLQNLFEQLEILSLDSLPEEASVAETTGPWNLDALLQPLPPQFQKQAPPHAPSSAAAGGGVLENLDQLMEREYHPDTVFTQDDQSVIAVDPTQQLVSSNLNQCYTAEASTKISLTLQTKRSPSQALFTVPPESIHFTPVGSSVDGTCAAADSSQQHQQPRKRQRR